MTRLLRKWRRVNLRVVRPWLAREVEQAARAQKPKPRKTGKRIDIWDHRWEMQKRRREQRALPPRAVSPSGKYWPAGPRRNVAGTREAARRARRMERG